MQTVSLTFQTILLLCFQGMSLKLSFAARKSNMRVLFWKQFMALLEKSSEIKGKVYKENSCCERHKSHAEL